MRILFLARDLDYGGAQSQLLILAQGLREQGHAVSVAVFYAGLSLERALVASGIQIYSLDKGGRWDLLPFWFRLIKCIRNVRPDIIHSYLTPPNLLAVALKTRFSRTRIVWGIRASNMKLDEYGWMARLLFCLERKLSRFADLIIVNSAAGLYYSSKHGFPIDKMAVIPNGIDTERFRPSRQLRRTKRAEWGIPEHVKVVGLIGRLDPMKDHPTFMRAAAMISEARKGIQFVCQGNGPFKYKQELLKLHQELNLSGSLIFIDADTDMPAVYNAMDVVVSSSAYGEGFSNVIGEAMACGVPCVVTAVGDSERVVGEAGSVVAPKNPKALEIAIEKLLDNITPGYNRGHEIRKRVVEHFSVSNLICTSESALLRLLN